MSASIEVRLAQNESCVFKKNTKVILQVYRTQSSSTGVCKRQWCKQPLLYKHLAGGSSPTQHFFISVNSFYIVCSIYGKTSKCQLSTIWINVNRAFQLEMKPQYCLILLHLTYIAWYNKFCVVCSIREYWSNVAETVEGYRKFRKLLRHGTQDSHI